MHAHPSIRKTQILCYACTALLFAVITALLLRGQSAMGFSDPNHWISRAIDLYAGNPQLRRVVLFPLYVGLVLNALGSAWVFLCNLPFVLLLAGLCGGLSARMVDPHRNLPACWRCTGFLLGASALLYFQLGRLSTLLNPYRDAPGMALGLLAWFWFLASLEVKGRRAWAWAFATGVICGLSLGFRETMILALLPLGVWTLLRVGRNVRERTVWIWLGCLLLGGTLGISPTLYQNWKYSGFIFVPAYTARVMLEEVPEEGLDASDTEDETSGEAAGARLVPREEMERSWQPGGRTRVRWDLARLIPGASPRYFLETSRAIRNQLRGQYAGVPAVFALVALVMAFRKKDRFFFGVVLPGFVLTFLFYSFYHYMNWRYVFFLHVCMAAVVGAGFASCLRGLAGLSRVRGRVPLWSGPVLAVLLFASWGGYAWRQISDNRLYVWDIPKFREALAPHLASPRTFLGFYHHREMLAWFVDEGFNHSPLGSQLHRDTVAEDGMDAALGRIAEKVWETLDREALYFHEMHHLPPLLPLWTEVRPVVNLADLPVQLYRYGRPMDGILYQVMPWQQTRIEFELDLGASAGPQVLLINPRRIWDDPSRTHATLQANDRVLTDRLENGPVFLPLPESLTGVHTLVAESDRALPAQMPHRLWRINEALTIPYGFRVNWWFGNLLSPGVQRETYLRRDAAQFIRDGGFRIPVFATADQEVFVRFRIEFVRQDGFFRDGHFTLSSGEGGTARDFPLPAHRTQGHFVLPLGAGTGSLAFHEVALQTDLPDRNAQIQMGAEGIISRFGFVKIFDAEVFTLPGIEESALDVTLGTDEDVRYVLGGVHAPERHANRWPVRWTDGRTRIRLPDSLPAGQPGDLTVSYFEHRPASVPGEVAIHLQGVVQSGAQPVMDPETRMYTLTLPSVVLPEGVDRVLEVVSPVWRPAEVTDLPDMRPLGIMLHRVQWVPED